MGLGQVIECVLRRSGDGYVAWASRDRTIRAEGESREAVEDEVRERVWEIFGADVVLHIVDETDPAAQTLVQLTGDALVEERTTSTFEELYGSTDTCEGCGRPTGPRTTASLVFPGPDMPPADFIFTQTFEARIVHMLSNRLVSQLHEVVSPEVASTVIGSLRRVEILRPRRSWRPFLPFWEVAGGEMRFKTHPSKGDRVCPACGRRTVLMVGPDWAYHLERADHERACARGIAVIANDNGGSIVVTRKVWRALRDRKCARGVTTHRVVVLPSAPDPRP